jgi:hypothetical protein
MAYTKLIPRHSPDARVEEISRGNEYRLTIPAGAANKYRLAQLDDYTQNPRGRFPWHASATLSLSARTSSASIPGTWGFGLWNDPFGMSLGFGGNPWRLPALPNAAWFFGASKESHLSFRDIRAELNEVETKRGVSSVRRFQHPSAQREIAANGFLAQTFRSPRFHPLLVPAGLALPFSHRATRRLLGRVIGEEEIDLRRGDQPVVSTEWHRYSLEWRAERVVFAVDEAPVLESRMSPNPPLGLVIWIDNQYAAFTPEGKIGFGVLENPEPAWLEIKDINIR